VRLVVIGAGAAGSAAAWTAARRGADVTLLSAQAGSSSLSSGAVDFDYDEDGGAGGPLETEALEFTTALGLWQLGSCRVATRQGVVRKVRGLDLALLNLEPLAGLRVALCDVDRDEWDGPALARSLGASPWARRTQTEFLSVPIAACRRGAERRISTFDFALLHDHPERLTWLGELLRKARVSADAWLLGPWLGSDISVAERLREQVGLPLGETSSPPAGPAGARFDRALDRLFAETAVKRLTLRAQRVERSGTEWRVFGEHSELTADAVVLAVGGVAAGGVVLTQDFGKGPRGFRLALELGARVTLDGDLASEASSLFGPSFAASGLGALERVGVELSSDGLLRSADGVTLPSVSAAGDCVAGRPRSLLEAVRAGCAAVRAVL
jgi:glycerol-3-phosphate dehydrogenase subunit B